MKILKLLILFVLFISSAYGRQANNVYRMDNGISNLPWWGPIDLSKSGAVGSSILGLGNGGTGINVCGNHSVPYSNGTTFVCNSSQIQFDGTNLTLASTREFVPGLDGTGRGTLFIETPGATLGFGSGSATLYGGVGSNGLGIEDTGGTSFPITVGGSVPFRVVYALVETGVGLGANGGNISVSSVATGVITLNLSPAFAGLPACTCSSFNNGTSALICTATPMGGGSSVVVNTTNPGNFVNSFANLICVGAR